MTTPYLITIEQQDEAGLREATGHLLIEGKKSAFAFARRIASEHFGAGSLPAEGDFETNTTQGGVVDLGDTLLIVIAVLVYDETESYIITAGPVHEHTESTRLDFLERRAMTPTPPPFTAKMDVDQYLLIAQAVRGTGCTLAESHRIAEAIHETFYNGPRFAEFDSMKQAYYTRHPAKK